MIHRLTGRQLATALRAGDLTVTEVIAHHVARSHQLQDTLNAFTHFDERAVARAATVEVRAAEGGDRPILGVPVAVKDLIDQEGVPTTCGSGFYRRIAGRTAPAVSRLEASGARVIGRTGLHEFAFGFSSENPWFGVVHNPWNPAHSPGGSSGGSAAAVAAGLVAGAVGTDTGGSVRVPAALCGIYGLKVTHGRVPLTGVFPLAPSLDTVGPLARTVDDLEALYLAMAGPDPEDPWSVPLPVDGTRAPEPLAGLRIGVPQPWVDRGPVTPEVAAAFRAALDRLTELGASVEEVVEPRLLPGRSLADLINGEAATVHRAWITDPDKPYGTEVGERLREALTVTLADYAAAQGWRAGLRNAAAHLFSRVAFLITPTTGAMHKAVGVPTIRVGTEEVSYRRVLSWFTSLVNHMGTPAMALPLAADGAPPPSLQIIGPWWSESRMLVLGRSLEEAGIVAHRPPPIW